MFFGNNTGYGPRVRYAYELWSDKQSAGMKCTGCGTAVFMKDLCIECWIARTREHPANAEKINRLMQDDDEELVTQWFDSTQEPDEPIDPDCIPLL